jgi:hypothetical protein
MLGWWTDRVISLEISDLGTIGVEPPGCMVERTILLVDFVQEHALYGPVRALVDQ